MQIPNCVPEYYREQDEREERKYWRKSMRKKWYAENERILNDAYEQGKKIMTEIDCPDEC